MNRILKLAVVLLCVFIFSACGAEWGVDAMTESPETEYMSTSPQLEYTLYFPDDAPYTYSHDITPDGMVYVHEIIKTNTTQISVKNTGDISIICNIYYPDDSSNIIMTKTIESGKSASFNNLTSVMNYCISFQSDETGKIQATISG